VRVTSLHELFSAIGWQGQRIPASEAFTLTLQFLRAVLRVLPEQDPDETVEELSRGVNGPHFVTNANTLASMYGAPEGQEKLRRGALTIGVPLASILAADLCGPLRLSESPVIEPDSWRTHARFIYAVLALLWRDHKELMSRVASGELEGEYSLRDELATQVARYAATSDERLIPALQDLYAKAVAIITPEERIELVVAVAHYAQEGRLSLNGLMPFLFKDPSVSVISTAALEFAQIAPPEKGDPLTGVRYLLQQADQVPEEATRVGILRGLLLLGDRRVIELLGPCWRRLSAEGRRELAQLNSGWLHAPLIDWFISWLEDCEGDEFGSVAAALARTARQARDMPIIETRRAFGRRDGELVGKWSREEYAEHIRHRLLQIAANEAPPRVMFDVLREWGINHMCRHEAGIFMNGPPELPRPLLPLLPASAGAATSEFTLVSLKDSDFLARSGQLLLCWAIFNPYGPTWSCFGTLPTEDPAVDLLFYRMLNPFSQQGGALATLRGEARSSARILAHMIRGLFERNTVGEADGCEITLLGGGEPSLVLVPWDDEAFRERVVTFFLASPRMAEFDICRGNEWLRAAWGDPWKRASLQREWAVKHLRPDGLVVFPERETVTTPELVMEWFRLVTDPEHIAAELVCFPGAWHGAIDHAGAPLGQHAFTFWQLDDFLSRNGFPVFRRIAHAAHESPGG